MVKTRGLVVVCGFWSIIGETTKTAHFLGYYWQFLGWFLSVCHHQACSQYFPRGWGFNFTSKIFFGLTLLGILSTLPKSTTQIVTVLLPMQTGIGGNKCLEGGQMAMKRVHLKIGIARAHGSVFHVCSLDYARKPQKTSKIRNPIRNRKPNRLSGKFPDRKPPTKSDCSSLIFAFIDG